MPGGHVLRTQMLSQTGHAREVLSAVGAVVVFVAIVFLELLVAVEELYSSGVTFPAAQQSQWGGKKDPRHTETEKVVLTSWHSGQA